MKDFYNETKINCEQYTAQAFRLIHLRSCSVLKSYAKWHQSLITSEHFKSWYLRGNNSYEREHLFSIRFFLIPTEKSTIPKICWTTHVITEILFGIKGGRNILAIMAILWYYSKTRGMFITSSFISFILSLRFPQHTSIRDLTTIS